MPRILLAVVISILLSPLWVQAGSRLVHGLGQDPMRVTSTYFLDEFGNSLPAIFQLYTRGGRELLTVTGIGNNIVGLAMVLTCPNGDTFRDGFDGQAPRIQARPTARGWCTLTVTHRTGRGTSRDFAFFYSRTR